MTVDLDAYCARIGHGASREPTLGVLQALHRLHPAAIPFENLATLLGRTPALDLESLQRKMLGERRGGYCFEHNRLFAAVLEALGFEVTSLAARVLWGRAEGAGVAARTHRLLTVRVPAGGVYLADVGFGGVTLTAPLLLEPGLEQATPHERFRIAPSGRGFVLDVETDAAWRPVYWFDLQEQLEIDFEVLNHFVATHPGSAFRTRLMAARALEDRRLALSDNRLTLRRRGGATESRELTTAEALGAVLRDDFGIALPETPELGRVLGRIAAPGSAPTEGAGAARRGLSAAPRRK